MYICFLSIFQEVDKAMKIYMFFEAFELKFNYLSYQYFLRVLLDNLGFDDGFDNFFSKRPFEKVQKSKFFFYKKQVVFIFSCKIAPISFNLDFDLFKLTLESPHEEISKGLNIRFLPMAELEFKQNRVTFLRDSDGKAQVEVLTINFDAQDFDFRDDGHESYKVFIIFVVLLIKTVKIS